MTKEIYNEIRVKPDFIYRYFLECKGKTMTNPEFDQLFTMWVGALGMSTPQAIRYILPFLDKKFGYTEKKS